MTVMITILYCNMPLHSEVTVDPIGIAVSVEAEDSLVVEVVLANSGDSDVSFSINFEDPPEERRRGAGPRRDDVEDIEEMMFAIIQDTQAWQFFDQTMCRYEDLLTLNENYRTFRNSDVWDDIDFEEYDAIVYAGCRQSGNYHNLFNENLERFTEYIDGGGAAYTETGDSNAPIRLPGGFNNDQRGDSNGVLTVSPDPDDDNYSLLAEICHSTQENNWNENEVIEGNAFLHSSYSVGQFNDAVEDGTIEWYQRIARPNNSQHLGAVAYGIGSGIVLAVGHPLGYGWERWRGEGNWGSIAAEILFYMTEMVGPKWILPDPEEGIISAEDSESVNFIIQPIDMEEGVYEMYILIELAEPEEERDDLEQTLIQISAIMSLEIPTVNVSGVVTDAETEEPVENAMLSVTGHHFARFTDEEGAYAVDDVPVTDYEITVTATDYLPHVETIEIAEAGEFEWNVELLHSECTPNRDEFFTELEPDMAQEFEFQIENGGNGPLTFTTERRLLGNANAEPWELRQSRNIEEVVEDTYLNGVVFAGEHFFVTGGNGGNNVNKIYKFNTDGEQVAEYDQFAESRYGMRDLAYDGTLIWGADDGVLYGFNAEGELVSEFNSPADIDCRSLAWDPDRELLWASDISTDIFAIDLEGELVETLERPDDIRVYGLGIWPDDPDGYSLYVFNRGDSTDLSVSKINLDDGDFMLAAEMDIDGGRPGGIQITNQLDVYSWVMVSLVQNTDRLVIWQLAARREWFRIEPVEGVIEADAEADFLITLDATALPINNAFEGEIVITHDGVGGETVLSVRIDVAEGEIQTSRDIEMGMGWNLVSANLQPDDEENIRGLMAALVEEELLILMKNSDGQFYRPDFDYSNIPGWYVDQGYQILLSGDGVLTLEGMSVLSSGVIELERGWQIASYYPRFEIEATVALSGIVENLIIAKDGRGNFYLPDWEFSNMGNLREGQGYFLNVDADVELVYQTEEANALGEDGIRQLSVYDSPGSLPVHTVTGENMSLLVTAEGEGEVGIYAGNQLVGSGVLQDGLCGIAVWGDDPATEAIDGAVAGQLLEIRLLDDDGLHNVSYSVLSGKTTYNTDSFAAIRLTSNSEVPDEFGIVSAYPNPFNSQTRIVYGLPDAARIDLAVYDLAGRRISELAKGRQQAGSYTVTFDGSGLASGVYMIRLEAGGNKSQWKVALVK